MYLPQFIALVGYPKAGKTEVQKYLFSHHDYYPVDDGRVIRDTCKLWFGWSEADVTTQDGKAAEVVVGGRRFVRRKIMQDVGRFFEANYGDDIVPAVALRTLPEGYARYSFGAVRRRQAAYYKRAGAVVFGVKRPETEGVWDGVEAEWYDPTLVDCWILNDGSLTTLYKRIEAALRDLRPPPA